MNPSVSFNEGPRQPIAATLFAFEDIGEGGPYRGIVDVDLPGASQCIQVPLAVDRMIFEPTSNLAQCPPQEGGVVAFTSRNQEVPEPFDLVCSEESICDADLGDALFFCFGQVVAECGDGRVDFPEACDGPTACSSLGFSGGTAGCNATCDLVDTSGCSVCGNGIIEEGEACDDPQDPSCFQCHRFLSEIEPNDDGTPDVGSGGISPNDFSLAAVVATGLSIVENTVIDAAYNVAGDEDGFLVENPDSLNPLPITMITFTGNDFKGCSGVDTGLNILDEAGQVLVANGLCSFLNFTIPPGGRIIIQSVAFGDSQAAPYRLRVRLNETGEPVRGGGVGGSGEGFIGLE